ncbi:MAG: hypothetical protein H6747_06330 [Deltaproteobacteria bacterium]|nr:hypothetical protein [Deltaproteobacteria bacterium]
MRCPSLFAPAVPLLIASVLLVGCGKEAPKPATPLAPPPAPALPTPMPDVEPTKPGQHVVAASSETIARGEPVPAGDQQHDRDAGPSQPVYHGNPDMKLDEQTLTEVTKTIHATSDLLEAGVKILEDHVDRPEKAADALRRYLQKHRNEVDATFHKAAEIRARLAAAGYDQDIPHELQETFSERMEAVQKRLEKMRDVYRDHIDALEAFGGFFPRNGPAKGQPGAAP